ncbi:Nuclear pore complex protein nup1 [Thalictrum thalictroides]|uniref:Nuclear pore complex protein nup1 n=1 Tax=Thalictrum thalictroides TaxID=46969 RepID=A0A7J6VQ86_THATH|nr:Nuclear pore complex protein nup1 [Thalictrum thalictroides]
MNDIEHIFKQKNFTRAEIDRLTELLRSRTADVSSEDEKRRFKTSTSHLVEAPGGKGSVPVQKHEAKSPTSLATMSGPLGTLNLLEEATASPTELAKAYMGSRTLKVTPSTLRYHDQASIQDVVLQNSVQFTPKSHSMSLVPKTASHNRSAPRGSEYGYLTPVPRGRSAIYNMARTPHSRVHHTVMFKGGGSLTKRMAGPSTSSQKSWENALLSGGNQASQASKRRSSVLDSDIGSVCSIRRVRRKTNMMFPSESTILSIPRASPSNSITPISSQAATVASIQKQLKLDGREHNVSVQGRNESGESSVAGKRSACVPLHSSRTAQKILQHLETLIPSPKGKSCEQKETTDVEKSPSKLTPDVRHGQALKSLEDVDSSKSHNARDDGVVVGIGDNHIIGESPSHKQVMAVENGPTKISISEDMIETNKIGVVTSSSAMNIKSMKSTEAFISCSVANDSHKLACEKTANKDSPELEDNKFSSRTSSNPSIVGKEIHDRLVVESKEIADETVTVGESVVSLADFGTPEFMKKSNGIGASNSYPAPDKNDGFTWTFTKPALSTSLSTSFFDKTLSPNQSTGVQFSFASKSVEKGLLTFSSASVGSESSGLNAAQSEVELQTVSSENSRGSNDGENVKDGDLHSKDIVSSSKSASASLGVFSFGVSTKSSLSNGSPALSTSLSSVPTSVSDTTSNVLLTNPGTTISSSTSPTAASVSAASVFQLRCRTSMAGPPSNSASIPTTFGIESTESEVKTNDTSLFGGLKNSAFGTTTSAFTGSSSVPFVFGASASSSANPSCADSQFQSSNISAAASGLFSCVQATVGTVSAPFTQSMPMQFGSSASSQTFGLTGPSPFSSSGSLFGSSVPGAKLFESGSVTAVNTSSILPTSTTGISSNLFGSSFQSAPSSIFGPMSSTTGFQFGPSSATTGSAPTPFGSSVGTPTGSVFSFTSAATVASPLSPSFPVFTATNPVSTVGSASPGNDQMNIEDSMAEDTVHPPTSVVPVFSQPSNSSQPSTFAFGAPSSSGGPTTFEFGSQQNSANLQNQSPFQASGTFGFSAGGSFSLGTGGGEKSNRRYFKARRDKSRNR